MGRSPGDEALTLTRSHSCELPQLYEALVGRKFVWGLSPQFNCIKEKISFFISFRFTA